MKKEHVIGTIWMAVLLAVSPLAMADGSEEETPKEEQEFKRNEPPVPEAVKAHLAYVEDLDRRYPDTSKVDPDRFMAEEGEKAALIYCRALGFDGPCEPDKSGQSILGRAGFDHTFSQLSCLLIMFLDYSYNVAGSYIFFPFAV